MAKKKPNYKLRRNLAKAFLVLIIIIPIILINRVKLAHLPLYLSNTKYTDVIDAMFEIKYTDSEAKNTLNYLKEKKKINDNTDDYILKLYDKGYSKKLKIIEEYKKAGYLYLDLYGITADFTDSNPYKTLNDFKLKFKPTVYEYIGEFDLIVNKPFHQLLWSTNQIQKEFYKPAIKRTGTN